ncbi:hypothetical protein [Streptomyces europaeiscabiei]|uniref:hypothetical protein n=1 Tax=Streptomyces europaeiscabiei TaxID=146819 RepID=UPI0029BF4C30|nr:hypothetical protein [Streptomyces europaeiscabiei]MDX2757929.1 hypothetical protein [Streptomyces europaeiscabiei]
MPAPIRRDPVLDPTIADTGSLEAMGRIEPQPIPEPAIQPFQEPVYDPPLEPFEEELA